MWRATFSREKRSFQPRPACAVRDAGAVSRPHPSAPEARLHGWRISEFDQAAAPLVSFATQVKKYY